MISRCVRHPSALTTFLIEIWLSIPQLTSPRPVHWLFEGQESVASESETRRVSFIWTVFDKILYVNDCVSLAMLLLICLLESI